MKDATRNPRRRRAGWLAAVLLLSGLSACALPGSQSGSGGAGAQGGATVSLAPALSALYLQSAWDGDAALARDFGADDVLTGELRAVDSATGSETLQYWSVYLDQDTLEAQSNSTLILFPGTYDFHLLVSDAGGQRQYAGSALLQEIVDGGNSIALTLRPLIGDTITDVQTVAELADFRFAYDPDELAGYADPGLGVRVDGGPEAIYAINPTLGLTDAYVNLPQGWHDLQLRFYSGALLRGRSVAEQEHVFVEPGVDLVLDLVALQGETVFELSEEGGEASFQFRIPAEVVEEAGGLADLQVRYAIAGDNNPLRDGTLSVAADGADYGASLLLDPFHYGEVTLSLTFLDQGDAPPEQIGACSVVFTADLTGQTVLCALVLHRRAITTGSLLATLGLNVYSSVDEPLPVAGATVRVDGGVAGLTGSGSFGTAGYLRLFLPAGDYTVRAEKDGRWGEIAVSLDPLDIANRVIFLDQEDVALTCHATEVLDYQPGPRKDGGPIDAERAHPENALGAPQRTDTVNFVSLGMGGSLTLGFATPLLNWSGDDLEVVETSYGNPSCSSYPEWVRVYASQTGTAGDWHDLGRTCRSGTFDLGNLAWASHLRFVDETNPADHSAGGDGFDIDGVVGHSCGTP